MSSSSEYSRLCRLINDSLPPYTESELISVTKQKEKDLLLALSQVSRKIQLWIYELDSDSYDDMAAQPTCTEKSENYEEHCCLTGIIANLIVFLTAESQYVQYLASKVLVVISEFVAVSGSNWAGFVRFLCVCFEVAIGNFLSSSLALQTAGNEISTEKSSFVVFVKPRLKNANWSAVAGIIRVLRNILKYLKQEYDDQLGKIYLDSISSCLSNVPWDSLNDVCVGQNGDTQRCSDTFSLKNVQLPESRVVFLGNLVQFFCSLVEQSGSLGVPGGSLDKHPVLCNINDLVPKLLYWCLGKQGNCNNLCISQYFKHKLLMLMIRLSFHIHLQYSILASWLQVLHEYFQDLLLQPICQVKPDENGCLEGSPFLFSILDGEVYSMSLRHLQRQAVFLFLRCSFSLISLREEIREQCAYATTNSCVTFDLNSNLECCSQKKGLSELYEWLQGHILKYLVVDHEMYWEKCIDFALSFLQLFMHEDDILFEVLLLMFSLPSCAEQQVCQEREAFQEMKEDVLLHVSHLFNPLHLFHLFLAELHYDHQVLLDYLISKDTGISCAEYILRCLRKICESWDLFVEFSVTGKFMSQSFRKKRKVFQNGPDSQVEPSSSPIIDAGIPMSLEKECMRKHNYGHKECGSRGQPFKEAKECLLSLKNSVENLHQKSLFPYNPQVLLRRLTRFHQLCLEHEEC
ncbi:uncharacterized protein LOC117917281 isoform X1 [Vitis riparia]|uniref:uncharacterized protein LOC117917281 isoform X1 n=1 Tax=Vitis riparia TaxID=96939 RepID=UPI00155B19BB|nr:uncharacterized protein LOC117917281 isoform X1 [Vitis riparia]